MISQPVVEVSAVGRRKVGQVSSLAEDVRRRCVLGTTSRAVLVPSCRGRWLLWLLVVTVGIRCGYVDSE